MKYPDSASSLAPPSQSPSGTMGVALRYSCRYSPWISHGSFILMLIFTLREISMRGKYIIIQMQFQRCIYNIYCVFCICVLLCRFSFFGLSGSPAAVAGYIEQHSQTPAEKAERNRLSAFLTVIERLCYNSGRACPSPCTRIGLVHSSAWAVSPDSGESAHFVFPALIRRFT